MNKEFESLKKKSLLTHEINPDTKPQVKNSELTKFMHDVKKSPRKRVVLLVEDRRLIKNYVFSEKNVINPTKRIDKDLFNSLSYFKKLHHFIVGKTICHF
jgi:hypothetical protein